MATDQPILVIDQNGPSYPILPAKRLGKDAPDSLWAIGRLDLINIPKTVLMLSLRLCLPNEISVALISSGR